MDMILTQAEWFPNVKAKSHVVSYSNGGLPHAMTKVIVQLDKQMLLV